MSFKKFNLADSVERGLEAAGYTEPTPIQDAAIPVILNHHDLIGTAQTGTGKTAAFVLPILHKLMQRPKENNRKTRALIITPTRELAEQINNVVHELAKFTKIKSSAVYGGVSMLHQERAFRQGVEIIVACPGRLLDHMERGNARLDKVEFLVLDEADRLLDMGFLPSIKQILKSVPPGRQTMLFSATLDKKVELLARQSLQSPKRLAMGADRTAVTVTHTFYPVAQHLKPNLLKKLLQDIDLKSVLVFTRTKHRAERIARKIQQDGFAAGSLHSNKSQNQRKHVMNLFHSGKIKIVVATDIAARGLDVSSISHVINFDVPECATYYIHRIGRTGRAERTGNAFTLLTPQDRYVAMDIEHLVGKPIERRFVKGFNYNESIQGAF